MQSIRSCRPWQISFSGSGSACLQLSTLGGPCISTMTRRRSKRLSSPAPIAKRARITMRNVSVSQSSTTAGAPSTDASIAARILSAEMKMSTDLGELKFSSPVTHVYNPLEYAWSAHKWYVNTFGNSERRVLLVGMNPGPWGMAQTGVPFGEVSTVRDWMKMPADMPIARPKREHEKRPVLGLATPRTEVSGRRLWQEWAKGSYETPENFFENFFVHNYCPLMFLESSGRNRTPVQLRAAERAQLHTICDEALRSIIVTLKPEFICGIGKFAATRCKAALDLTDIEAQVGTLLHPSPASPAANKGWVEKFTTQLNELMETDGNS